MKKITLSALTLIAALAAGSALAAEDHPMPPKDGGPRGEHMFKETDTNGDGTISKEEWTAKGDKMFKDIDSNGDGKISKDEMKAHHEKMHEMREKYHEKMEEKKAEGEKKK